MNKQAEELENKNEETIDKKLEILEDVLGYSAITTLINVGEIKDNEKLQKLEKLQKQYEYDIDTLGLLSLEEITSIVPERVMEVITTFGVVLGLDEDSIRNSKQFIMNIS